MRWLLRGQHHTEQVFKQQDAAIRALQEQVGQLAATVADLEAVGSGQVVVAARAEVRSAIADLGGRIDALAHRVDASESDTPGR